MARRRSELLRLAGAIALIAGLSMWIGCSSETLQPSVLTPAGEEGEVSIEPIDTGIPTPGGVDVRVLNPNCLCLTWNRTTQPYIVHVGLDGVMVGTADGRTGVFTQAVGKFAGEHTYQICFGRGCRSGTAVRITFFVNPSQPNEPIVTRVEEDD